MGLKINNSKTNIMKIHTKNGGTIGGEGLEEVEQVIYLGSDINKTGGTDEVLMPEFVKLVQLSQC